MTCDTKSNDMNGQEAVGKATGASAEFVLAPCPFCAGMANVYPAKLFGANAGCTVCDAEVFGMTQELAVAAWNRRALDDAPTWEAVRAREKDIRELQSIIVELRETPAATSRPVPAVYLSEDLMHVLSNARELAMRAAATARSPECGDFGVIAQGLEEVITCIERGVPTLPVKAPLALTSNKPAG